MALNLTKLAHYEKLSPTVGLIRVFNSGKMYELYSSYESVVVAQWKNKTTIELKGAKGKFTKETIVEIIKLLESLGATTILATRAHPHKLPAPFIIDTVTENIIKYRWALSKSTNTK